MPELIGASQPFGVTKKLAYQMAADRYTGRVLYVSFRTDADLGAWLPPPLVAPDPHAGFLKLYRLKRRPERGSPLPPAFSQYHEACVTVLAGPPGDVPRQYNMFMWVDHDWALYKAREALGWPKKLAQIDITATYPGDGRYDRDHEITEYRATVSRYGSQIIDVRARLDPMAEPQPVPPFNGFYTVRHLPAALDGGAEVRELLVVETRDGWFGDAVYGHGEITFGDAADEELAALGDVVVTGCALRDVGWVLPGWPARKVADLEPFEVDLGDPLPTKEIAP